MRLMKLIVVLGVVALLPQTRAEASLLFDQNITAIFGSGNADTHWTVSTDSGSGVTLGLRAKVRYDVSDNLPKNIFNSNGNGTYDHAAGAPASHPTRARWNFEWSINSGNFNLDDLTYRLDIDNNPGWGTTFVSFDPINLPYADHSIGTSSTLNGQGVEAPNNDTATYANLIANNTVAQNSWNLDWFDSAITLDPNAPGRYTFRLNASQGEVDFGTTEITVIVGNFSAIPEPGTIAIWSVLGAVGLIGSRRRRIG